MIEKLGRGAVLAGLLAGGAWAQEEAPPPPQELGVIEVPQASEPAELPPAPVEDAQLEEVIVTAQRRAENLQKVPISITVFDQEQLTNANVTNSGDLARYTPSLSTNSRFGEETATFTIRGFTQDLRTTASVGTYFAEVVAPRGQSTQTSGDGAGPGSLFDLENVQVLKGPQGTLFGRNTTGGAILLVPKKPKNQFEGFAELSGGDYTARRGQAVVNFPLGDSLSFRVGVDRNSRKGLLHNFGGVGPEWQGNVNYTAARLSAVWEITDSLENYAIAQYVDSDTHGSTSQLYACNNLGSNLGNIGGYSIEQLLAGLVQIIQSGGDVDLTNPLPGVPLGGSPLAFLTFQACEQQLAEQEAAGRRGRYDILNDVPGAKNQIREKRFINTTTWNITENVTFKNIVAYAHLFTNFGSNIFGNRFPDQTDPSGRRVLGIGHTILRTDMPVTSQKTWVEEMQLQGTSFEGRLTWQGGLYYEHSMPDGFSGNSSVALVWCEIASIETNDPSQYNCFDPFEGIIGGPYRYKVKTTYLNQAAYAQGTYKLFDPLSVTVGLRYTWDDTRGLGVKEFYPYVLTQQQAPRVTTQEPRTKSRAPTGVVELNYQPFETLMTYAKYTRGYRQGTVNMLADPGLDVHEPERVDTYEIGMKSNFSWPVPGRFNIALFDNTLTNMQLQGGYVSTTSGPTTAIFNAGEGTSRGLEIEAYLRPFQPIGIALSYSYLKTRLVESADFCPRVEEVGFLEGFTCTPIADAGNELPFAPKSAYVANLTWTLPFPGGFGVVDLGTTYAYTGRQRVAADSSTPFAILPGFGLLNLNLNWTGIFGTRFDFAAFATNVLDEEFIIYTTGTYKPLGIESRNPGPPRMIGGRLRFNF